VPFILLWKQTQKKCSFTVTLPPQATQQQTADFTGAPSSACCHQKEERLHCHTAACTYSANHCVLCSVTAFEKVRKGQYFQKPIGITWDTAMNLDEKVWLKSFSRGMAKAAQREKQQLQVIFDVTSLHTLPFCLFQLPCSFAGTPFICYRYIQ